MRGIGARVVLVLMAAAPAFAQQAPPSNPDRNFLETIVDDVRSVVSEESATLLTVASAFALLASPFDETLTYSASCSTFLKTTFGGWARVAGQEWMLGSGAVATYLIGRATNKPKITLVGADLVESQLLSGAATFALKHSIRRGRPDGEPRSFPSGHAAGTFAAAAVVQRHFGVKAAIPAYGAAALISGARLQANSHYPTDIILGAAIGMLSGRAATFELGRRRVSLSPAVAEGGGLLIGGSIQ